MSVDIGGTDYLLALAHEVFKVDSLEGIPKHPDILGNINMLYVPERERVFQKIMDIIIDRFFISPLQQDIAVCLYLAILLCKG